MNTRTPLETPSSTVVLSISFNGDCSCFAVGLNTGFCSKSPAVSDSGPTQEPNDEDRNPPPPSLYLSCLSSSRQQFSMQKHVLSALHGVSQRQPTPCAHLINQPTTDSLIDFNAGVGLVQMMGKANYIGLVGGGRQPKFAANKASPLPLLCCTEVS